MGKAHSLYIRVGPAPLPFCGRRGAADAEASANHSSGVRRWGIFSQIHSFADAGLQRTFCPQELSAKLRVYS